MALKRKVFFVGLIVQFGLLVTACSPFAESLYRLKDPGRSLEPTSITLKRSTPKPSATSLVIITPTPTATENFDLDYYYGGLTIGMDDVGRIFPLRKGQSFSLYLGGDYHWRVESIPVYLISQNVKITPAPGEQGIFIARERGEGVLKAVGEPACRQEQPPCERPNIIFQISVVIE